MALHSRGFLQLHNRLWNEIRARMKARGITHRQAAERMGIERASFSTLFLDRTGDWRLSTLYRMAQAVGCRLKVELEDEAKS